MLEAIVQLICIVYHQITSNLPHHYQSELASNMVDHHNLYTANAIPPCMHDQSIMVSFE